MANTKQVIIEIVLSSATGRNRLQGIFDFLRGRADWDIRLPQTRDEFEKSLAEDVDGIITSRVYSVPILRSLERRRTPVVFMDIDRQDRLLRRATDITIANDNGGIGLMAARYLLTLGKFRSFGYIPFSSPKHWSERRQLGFENAVRKSGQSVNVFNSQHGDLAEWIGSLPRPTAIFCACDAISREALEACRRANVKVPSQAVILGVDNDELICQIARPELSSVRPDTHREGFEAAKALNGLMNGKTMKSTTILVKPIEVVERTSTHPPPPAAHLVQRALEFISQNAVRGITSDDVAREVGCSRRLLDLRFATYHTQTPHDAIVSAKLDAVCRELKSSPRRFSHIARDCGFKNADVLRNLFRKVYGTSMRDFRRGL